MDLERIKLLENLKKLMKLMLFLVIRKNEKCMILEGWMQWMVEMEEILEISVISHFLHKE